MRIGKASMGLMLAIGGCLAVLLAQSVGAQESTAAKVKQESLETIPVKFKSPQAADQLPGNE